MKRTKTLIASISAIVLCFAMLIGTTFAWFTDSVVNTNNVIKSGNVDVELYHKSNNAGEFEEVKGNTKLFINSDGNEIIWEPGVSTTEEFKIVNAGTLALKYKFSVKALAKELNADGNSLLDVITVTAMVDGVEEIVSLGKEFEGTIVAGAQAHEYKINLKWNQQGDKDNDYSNLKLVLGVELLATQVYSEQDGTGTGFDDGIEFTNVSNEVDVTGDVTEDVTLVTKGENAVKVSLPTEFVNSLPEGVESISLVHTEPVVDEEFNVITFSAIELVDQNGTILDLSENDKEIQVKLYVPELKGMTVDVMHDGEHVANVEVDAEGYVTYLTSRFSEVKVLPSFEVGSVFRGINPVTINENLLKEDSNLVSIHYIEGGVDCYVIAERLSTRVVFAGEINVEQNANVIVETNVAENKLHSIISGLTSVKNLDGKEKTTVYLLPGTYNAATTITVSSSMDIIGLGDKDTIKVIKQSSTSQHLFNCAVQKADYGEITIKNLYLDATVKTTANKENGAVQVIRKTKVKCYDLTIVKSATLSDAQAFYLNASNVNTYDNITYNAYLYIENCTTNVKMEMMVITGSNKNGGNPYLRYNGLTYGASFDTPYSRTNIQGQGSGKVTVGAMATEDWDWEN